jgi:hypothetical protein
MLLTLGDQANQESRHEAGKCQRGQVCETKPGKEIEQQKE